MTAVDVTGWAKRNLWLKRQGVCVRPGFRTVLTPSSARIYAAWTMREPITGVVRHYICTTPTGGTKNAAAVTIYDESLRALGTILTGIGNTEPVTTHAEVYGQVLIQHVDEQPWWGLIGQQLTAATSKASANPATTVLDNLPRGLAVSWANRAVVAEGSILWFSDPSDFATGNFIRTFVAANGVVSPGGQVFGLHVSQGGALVVCCTGGVFALSEQAAAVQIVTGDWQQLSDHQTVRHRSTAAYNGRVYGLSPRGIKQIDTEGGTELDISEPFVPTASLAAIASDDWRRDARLISWSNGLFVAAHAHKAVCAISIEHGFRSWWTMTHTSGEVQAVIGTLNDNNGNDYLVTTAAVYLIIGNHDGSIALSENATAVLGGYIGNVPTNAADSPVLREVTFASDTGGNIKVTANGAQKTSAPPQGGVVAGTSVWGTAVWGEPPLRSRRLLYATRTDDVGLEVMAENPGSRVGDHVDVVFKGHGAKRPTG